MLYDSWLTQTAEEYSKVASLRSLILLKYMMMMAMTEMTDHQVHMKQKLAGAGFKKRDGRLKDGTEVISS